MPPEIRVGLPQPIFQTRSRGDLLPEKVTARLDTATRARLERYCTLNGLHLSEAVRRSVEQLTNDAGALLEDAGALLEEIIQLLGLPDGATADEIHAALDLILGDGADAVDPTGDAAPAAPSAAMSERRTQAIARAEAALASNATKPLTRAELAYCTRTGMSEAAFRTKKANAVRRSTPANVTRFRKTR